MKYNNNKIDNNIKIINNLTSLKYYNLHNKIYRKKNQIIKFKLESNR